MSTNGEIANCPNCNTRIGSGLFNAVFLLPEKEVRLINVVLSKNTDAYCDKCGKDDLAQARQQYKVELTQINNYLQENIIIPR